jgi:ubiquitin-conjugating enzyme (huntingtin interacting protein 2)
MAGHRARRVTKELADIKADSVSHINVDTVGDSVTKLKGSFQGPPGTAYEGGTFEVDISIPNEYPFKPPVMKFLTKIWHPNVSSVTVSPVFMHKIPTDLSRVQSALTLSALDGRLYSLSRVL